jgi:hypothetical protein
MKKTNPIGIFSAAFNLQRADLNSDTKERFSKLLVHSSRTNLILFIVLIASLGFALESKFKDPSDIQSIVLISAAPALIYLYLRYIDLQKKVIRAIKEMEKTSNNEAIDAHD